MERMAYDMAPAEIRYERSIRKAWGKGELESELTGTVAYMSSMYVAVVLERMFDEGLQVAQHADCQAFFDLESAIAHIDKELSI